MKLLKLSFLIAFFFLSIYIYGQNFSIGFTEINLVDSSRNNRDIPVQVFYPAMQPGEDAVVVSGDFPVISFGHGFVMTYEAYVYLWEYFVPRGYILAFAKTETGPFPDHSDFGLDLVFIVQSMADFNLDSSSLFYGHITQKNMIIGHSMGGGCAYLGISEAGFQPTAVVSFAAAETQPSAITAAGQISVPGIVFAAEGDSVTPPNANQWPVFQNLASSCKAYIKILGGAHCYFANENTLCDLGESLAGSSPSITRQQQQNLVTGFLEPYLSYYLQDSSTAFDEFETALDTSQMIDYFLDCSTDIDRYDNLHCISVYPNPVSKFLHIDIGNESGKEILVLQLYDQFSSLVMIENLEGSANLTLDISTLIPGIYFMLIFDGEDYYKQSIVVQ
jgi:pimeloyl-ACP methyl ester carboxylesterase